MRRGSKVDIKVYIIYARFQSLEIKILKMTIFIWMLWLMEWEQVVYK